MQLEFNLSEYLVGKCRFTSSVLIPWAKILKMTISDKTPSIDGILNTPWSSNLNKQTVDFEYCSIEISDPLEITIDLPWAKELTKSVQTKKLFDI